MFQRAVIDVRSNLLDRHAKVCAELDRLRCSCGGGAKRQARIARLTKECEKLEAAIYRLDAVAS